MKKNSVLHNVCFVLMPLFLSVFLFASCSDDGGETNEESQVTCTIQFMSDVAHVAGSTAPVTGKLGSTIVLPANGFSLTGYTFAGWNTKTDGSGTSYNNQESIKLTTESLTLYAQWTLIKDATFSVQIQDGITNGTLTADATEGIEPETTVTLTALPEKGYELSSIFISRTDTYETVSYTPDTTDITKYAFIMPHCDVSITVVFNPKSTHTVTYDDGVDDEDITVPVDTAEYNSGDTVTIKFDGIGERSGYSFTGWSRYTTADGFVTYREDEVTTFIIYGQDVTLTACWSKNATYTVTYIDGVDSDVIAVPVDSAEYNSGDIVTVAFDGIGERSGYTFSGWSDGTTTYTSDGQTTLTITTNITLTAQWTASSDNPSEPEPENPSEPEPENPSDTEPDTPSDSDPDTPSDTTIDIVEKIKSMTESGTITADGEYNVEDIFVEIRGALDYLKENKPDITVDLDLSKITGRGTIVVKDNTFANCSNLSGITLPENLYAIGSKAFNNCTGLKRAVIPEGLTYLSSSIFSGCPALEEMTVVFLGDSTESEYSAYFRSATTVFGAYFGSESYAGAKAVTQNFLQLTRFTAHQTYYIPSSLKKITVAGTKLPYGAFNNCTDLTGVVILDTVTYIGETAFDGCIGLETVEIGSGIESIGDSAFSNCSALTEVTISEGVTSIGNYVFSKCTTLTEVTIPCSVASIGNHSFFGCTSLEKVMLQEGLSVISDYLFDNCALRTMTIPRSVSHIGKYAFGCCKNLTSIEIPFGVESIGDMAFDECESLSEVIIPDSVTVLGWSVFANCAGLTKLVLGSGITEIGKGNGFDTAVTNLIIKISADGLERFNSIFYDSLKEDITGIILKDSVTTIPAEIFASLKSLKHVEILGAVTTIGDSAFKNCTELIDITLPDSLTSIGEHAFDGCRNLTGLTLPNSLTSIGEYAFYWCDNLTDITIPEGVTSIEDYVFFNCESLTSVTLPSTLKTIGEYAFYHCGKPTDVTIPDGVTTIGDYAFEGCSLSDITIPDSVTSIGECAFSRCGITSLLITSNEISIGAYAFARNSRLSNITILSNVVTSGGLVFNECTGLKTATVGNGVLQCHVRFLGKYITTVTIVDGVTSIPDSAFYNRSQLTTVTLPKSVTSIGKEAFYKCTNLKAIAFEDTTSNWYESSTGYSDGTLIGHMSANDEANAMKLKNIYSQKYLYNERYVAE